MEINEISTHFRPFLDFKNNKKHLQEKLDNFEGEENTLYKNNITATSSNCSLVQLLKGIGGLKGIERKGKILKYFSDGRVWIEIGKNELLLMQNWDNLLEKDNELNSQQSSFTNGNNSFTSSHYHLTNFKNNTILSSMTRTNLGERVPFYSFYRSFRCLLNNKEFIKNDEEKEQNNDNSFDDRENVRRILKRAGIAEHRYRLGLSQILLQRDLLEEMENKRDIVLIPLLANCRKYLISKRIKKEKERNDAIKIIQWNFECWENLKKSEWWKLFIYIKPLIPAASSDARERRLREHVAQLELDLDELRSEYSRTQLELESAQKSKQIAEKWSEEIEQQNKKLINELEDLEGKFKKVNRSTEQINGNFCKVIYLITNFKKNIYKK